ncbi:Hypothetical Protein OBI_RACECAR_222 [Arthrobacter phage Racecar]|nr:hypothetical protein PBI_RACECAR_14 [Arthrobacter phage Racecar]QFG12699.1 hypothetical protein PBI_MIMI_14 [Arthrobacter phage Mimi]
MTEFNIGDKVRFTNKNHPDWVGQEGVVEKIDRLVYYRITKASTNWDLVPYFPELNTVGNTVKVSLWDLEVIEPANSEPESAFKVGDVVRLTKQGGSKDRMPFLNEGLRATVTRVQWYRRSEEFGYYLDIPGITDLDYLEWVDCFEFYGGDFVHESELKNASLEALKKAKPGTVVWDEDGDKWVRVSRKKQDAWVFIREDSADLKDSVFIVPSEELRGSFAPISFIKP